MLRLKHRCWSLNNAQLSAAIRRGLVGMPNVCSYDLKKLDRGDKLVKLLALAQIIYLIVQLIARKVANLPSTQLEIAALAFSASSMITYLLYWSRPQGVDSVKILKATRLPCYRPIQGCERDIRDIVQNSPTYLWTHCRTRNKKLDPLPLPNDGSNVPSEDFDKVFGKWGTPFVDAIGWNYAILPLAFGAVVGGMLFGGLHCLAWEFHFPTTGERLAWRTSSILTTCLPILSILPLGLWMYLSPWHPSKVPSPTSRFLAASICILLLTIYTLARLFLIVEIFRSLFFLPPEAFIETWSGSFPHFG